MPESGEPYRPFIAMPSKFRDILWFSNCDVDFFTAYDPPKTLVPAAAMNPTITTNAGDPQAETQAPVPGSTQQDSSASKTTADLKPTVTPAQDPQNSQPTSSKDPVAMIPDPIPTRTPTQGSQVLQPKVSNDPAALVPDPKSTRNPMQAPQHPPPDGTGDPAPTSMKGDSGAGPDPNVPVTKAQDPAQTQTPGGSAKDPGEGADSARPNQSQQTNNPANFDSSNVKSSQMSVLEGALALGNTAAPLSQPQSQAFAPAVGSPDPPQTQGAAPMAAPAQSQGLGAIIVGAMGAAPATPEQPTKSPVNLPPSANSGTVLVNNPQVGPSEAVMVNANQGQIIASSGGHVGAIGTQVINTPVSIAASQPAIMDGVVSQVLKNSVPNGGHLFNPTEEPQVTAAVESAIQSGLADGVTTVNNELIKSIAHNILTETTSSPPAAPIQLGSSAIVIEGASSVDLGPFLTTIASKPVTTDLTAVQSAKYTLAAGAPGVTIDGTAISVGTAGQLVEDSRTMTVAGPSVGPDGLIIGGLGPVVTTVGGQHVTADPTAVEIAGSTLKPGAPGVTVGGTVVSFDIAGDLLVGSQTAALEGTSAVVNIVATLANGAVISAGGSPTTVDGNVVAIPSDGSGLVVNGNTIPLPTARPTSVFSVAGQAFTAAPGGFAIGSQTLSPEGPAITLSGTPLSLSLGPSGLQIGNTIISLPSAAPNSVFTVGGQAFTAAPSGFAIGSQTLSPEGPAITLSGTPLSLGSLGLQIGSSTIFLPSAAPNSVFTVAGQAFTAAPSGFAIDSQSLSRGGSAITLSGTVVSLGSSGLQIGDSTISLPSAAPNSVFTVGGQAFTAAPSGFAIGSQSLSLGRSAITLSGTVVSLGSSGLQIGTSLVSLQASGAQATSTSSLTSPGDTSSAHGSGTLGGGKSSKGMAYRMERYDMCRIIAVAMAVISVILYI